MIHELLEPHVCWLISHCMEEFALRSDLTENRYFRQRPEVNSLEHQKTVDHCPKSDVTKKLS